MRLFIKRHGELRYMYVCSKILFDISRGGGATEPELKSTACVGAHIS